MCFPSFGFAEIHPFVALEEDFFGGCSPLDPRSLFEKSSAKTFKKDSDNFFIVFFCYLFFFKRKVEKIY